jgi:hypothetical protein
MKRTIYLALLILAGCGGGGDSAPTAQPAPVSAPVASAEPVPAPAPEPVAKPAEWLTVPPNVEGWGEPVVILTASQAWEFTADSPKGSVFEPSVLYDSSSATYTMWYSGGWEKCSTGTATSTDGIHWTKNPSNPLIGQGKMGRNIACRNSVIRINGETYVYFVSNVGTQSAIYVTHSQDGVTGLTDPQVVILSGDWDLQVANSWPVLLPDGKVRLFYDSITTTGAWEAFSARCDGPLGPCYKDPPPLKGLQTGKGSYGGGWARLIDGRFDTYYLAGPNGVEGGHVPTYLYHACDASAGPVAMGNNGQPLLPLEAGYDQHGDPFVMDGAGLPDGNSRLYFDKVDNPRGYADIIMSSRVGALSTVKCP